MPIEQYEKIKSKLLTTFDKYGLTEDREELIYIIIIEDENLDGTIYGDKLRSMVTILENSIKSIESLMFNFNEIRLFMIIKDNVLTIFIDALI